MENHDGQVRSTLTSSIDICTLPEALQNVYLVCKSEGRITHSETSLVPLNEIYNLTSGHSKIFQLLLHREKVTAQLAEKGQCRPQLVLTRARIYEALEYDDLAAFDAFVVYTLCQKHLSDEFVTDLEAYTEVGRPWPTTADDDQDFCDTTRTLKLSSLAVLIRCLWRLGATKDAHIKRNEFREDLRLLSNKATDAEEWPVCSKPFWTSILNDGQDMASFDKLLDSGQSLRFGLSRREVYPWSSYEPSRNSPESVLQINAYLSQISTDVEARITALPAFDSNGDAVAEMSYQLGLFAKKDLGPGEELLAEKSILMAIRPLEDAICDACGQDLEDIPFEETQQCEGDDCDVTYCSEECKQRAVKEYHRPATAEDDEGSENESTEKEVSNTENGTDEAGDIAISAASRLSISSSDDPSKAAQYSSSPNDDYEEPEVANKDNEHPAPFCGNTDLSIIGRSTNTETPEWDLYFLLLTRTVAMSVTQDLHPLDLREIKYLWGDFNPSPIASPNLPTPQHLRTLPFSLHHNLQLPLDFFTTLSLTNPSLAPYSAHWLRTFDFWILQTLHAKFRGVANATQSTFDGKPEVAAVHPGWCLANHSCAPNVRWTPKGVRRFLVRTAEERTWAVGGDWEGIRAGEEVFSHYTDVRLPVEERRERLREVLGGRCRCERCMAESGEV